MRKSGSYDGIGARDVNHVEEKGEQEEDHLALSTISKSLF